MSRQPSTDNARLSRQMSIGFLCFAALGLLIWWGAHWLVATHPSAGDRLIRIETVRAQRAATRTAMPPKLTPTATAYLTTDTATTKPSPTALRRRDPTPAPPSDTELREWELFMFDLVNQDRLANGCDSVQWDVLAADVARAHAQEMAEDGYFSHWNQQGYLPFHRWALAGGTEYISENLHIYWRRWRDGAGYPIQSWETRIADAQAGLMKSPGHRANIVTPGHTHVGIGMAYNEATGTLVVAQEFLNRYVYPYPRPGWTSARDEITLRGMVLTDPGGILVAWLEYEPHPIALTPYQLDNEMPNAYGKDTEYVALVNVKREGDHFEVRVPLDDPGTPGIYHVEFVFLLDDDESVWAADWILWLRE